MHFKTLPEKEVPCRNLTEHLLFTYSLVLSAVLLANCQAGKSGHGWKFKLVPVSGGKTMKHTERGGELSRMGLP